MEDDVMPINGREGEVRKAESKPSDVATTVSLGMTISTVVILALLLLLLLLLLLFLLLGAVVLVVV